MLILWGANIFKVKRDARITVNMMWLTYSGESDSQAKCETHVFFPKYDSISGFCEEKWQNYWQIKENMEG